MKARPIKCASCRKKECSEGDDCFGSKADPRPHLDDEDLRILRCASEIEAEFYLRMTRLEELIEFSRRMGYRRLGVAFCVGLSDEAKVLAAILGRRFTVFSVCCKACGLDKRELKLAQVRKDRREAMCNPVGQALLLASEDTELNVAVGLCMGHDVLFAKHSRAPVTTLVVKDRVLAHNPLGAVYSGYHLRNRFLADRDGRALKESGS